MNRFLLLALTAGLLSPIAVKSERHWLIIDGHGPSPSILKIEMESAEQCEEMGWYWQHEKTPLFKKDKKLTWLCLKGK